MKGRTNRRRKNLRKSRRKKFRYRGGSKNDDELFLLESAVNADDKVNIIVKLKHFCIENDETYNASVIKLFENAIKYRDVSFAEELKLEVDELLNELSRAGKPYVLGNQIIRILNNRIYGTNY